MSLTQRLGPFRELRSGTAGDVPLGLALSLRNVRVGDGRLLPRYGFRSLAAAPAGARAVHGLARLVGYDANYVEQREWVSVENRDGTVRPYAVDPTTWARTEITNGGASLALNGGDWLGFGYDDQSYWINPGGTPSTYRHEVGNDASWTALQDEAYVEPTDDPTFDVGIKGATPRALDPAGDTLTAVTTGNFLNSRTYVAAADGSGNLEVHGSIGDASSVAHIALTCAFAATVDMSYDIGAIEAVGGAINRDFSTGCKIEVQIAGAWSAPLQKAIFASDRKTMTLVFRMKGVAGANAVQAIRITLYSDPWANQSNKLGFTLSPIAFGGTYVGADNSTDRPWDATYRTSSETYGVRFKNISLGTYTGIKGVTRDASRYDTVSLGPADHLGDNVLLTASADLQTPYVDDPAGTSFTMEWLRKDLSGTWRVIGSSPNSGTQSFRDRYEAWELSALPSAPDDGYTTPDAAPVFTSGAFVAGVPFKGWVVWLLAGGKGNVRHSRVGDAEALYSPGDGTDDEARGADFTLADDFADEPLGGVQAGDALLVPGRQGVYGQSGNYPSQMTPFRKLPGSMGCAGRFAFARYRDVGGNPGLVWLDTSGENVWFAAAGLVYPGDTQARPVELSLSIRGTLRNFLLTEQLAAFPDLTLAEARLDVDEATGSLWVVLGARAAVLRPPSPIDGAQGWELSEFALGTAGTVAEPHALDSYGATAVADVARPPATLAWTNPANALPGTPVASAGAFTPGLSSHWLVGTGFMPPSTLPADATVASLKATVRHRATSTGSFPTPVSLSAAISGSLTLAPAHAVPAAFENIDVDLFGLLPLTPAALNAGIDLRIAYDAASAAAYDPANWSIDYSPKSGGPSGDASSGVPPAGPAPYGSPTTWPVKITWIGPGAAPSTVLVAIHATSSISGPYNVPGNVVLNNGIGTTSTGTIVNPGTDHVAPADSTVVFALPVSGGVATKTVTMTRSNTGNPSNNGDFGPGNVRPSIAAPDPSTVEVESILLTVGYTVPVAVGTPRIAYLAFGPRDEGLVWLRSTGALDAAEWDPGAGAYVDGLNRDGGVPMPDGWWESGRLPGVARRLTRVEVEREGFGPVALAAYTDRLPLGEAASAFAAQRWARFSPGVQGRTHRLRIEVKESSGAVRAVDMVFDALAGPDR